MEERNYAIQYLRALAALAVVLFHAAYYLSLVRHDSSLLPFFDNFGFFGVDLFFAISGYLMARIAPASAPWKFLAHRIVRIYPLFLIVAASVFLFKLWSGSPIPFDPFAFALIPGGPRTYIVGTEWTLPFEMTFYVAIFMAIGVGAARLLRLAAAIWIVVIFAAMMMPAPILTYANAAGFPPLSLLLISRISTGFALGLLLPASVDDRVPKALLLAVAVACAIAGYFNYIYVNVLMGIAGACLVAAASSRTPPFQAPFLAKLGDWSYALYLVHVPVVLLVFRLLPAAVSGVAAWFAAVLFSIAAAIPLGAIDVKIYRSLRWWSNQRSPAALAIFCVPFLVSFLSAAIFWDIHERTVRDVIAWANTLGAETSGSRVLTDRFRAKGMRESPDLRGWIDRIVDERQAGDTLFDGWALDMTGKDQSPAVLIFVNGTFVRAAVPVIAREDVLKALNPTTRSGTIGFFTAVSTSICKTPSVVEILIVSGDRFATIPNSSLAPDCSGIP